MMLSPFFGLIQIAWLSLCAMPCCNDLNVLPPSVDLLKFNPPTYTFSGLVGSTRIWLYDIGRLFSLLTIRHVSPLSSARHTPGFFGSSGVGVGDAAGLGLADGDGLGLGAGPPGCGSSPPVPVLAPTSICA